MLFSCVTVSILRCLCVFLPPGFPLHAPQQEMVYVNVFLVRTNVGLAAGNPVTAVFEYCDVCDVNIALEAFGVSNSGEK